jgi:hypothetical protein
LRNALQAFPPAQKLKRLAPGALDRAPPRNGAADIRGQTALLNSKRAGADVVAHRGLR